MLLAALIVDVTGLDPATSPIVVARKTCQRLDVGAATEQAVAGLVADAGLLLGAARRLDGLGEESVLQLAAHLGTPAQADALFLLTEAYVDLDTHDRARLATLRGLVTDVLSHPELVGRVAIEHGRATPAAGRPPRRRRRQRPGAHPVRAPRLPACEWRRRTSPGR